MANLDVAKTATLHEEDGDLQEEEIWAMLKRQDKQSSSSNISKSRMSKDHDYSYAAESSSSNVAAWRSRATPRAIPRAYSDYSHQAYQSSAPMNIQDWSKILKMKSNKNMDHACDDDDGEGGIIMRRAYSENVDGFESDDDEMVPPHEYLAKRLARTQIVSFSMCEGIGRTLKGRDLSKVRNAILSKTGFIE